MVFVPATEVFAFKMTFYLFGSGVYFAYLSFNNFSDRSAKTNTNYQKCLDK